MLAGAGRRGCHSKTRGYAIIHYQYDFSGGKAKSAARANALTAMLSEFSRKHCYWKEMLDFVGIRLEQLPELVEPCCVAGTLKADVAAAIGFPTNVKVNIGTLDHFSGMIGTGNVQVGGISLSTGTVMGLSTVAANPLIKGTGIPLHYGFKPETYVMLYVAESGGACLEWVKQMCLPNISYAEIDETLSGRTPGEIVFLPYLISTNSPEFDHDVCGIFFGLRSKHDAYDMTLAVMEGVAHLLKKNCDHIQANGTPINHIIATGGGARSPVWCQMQADITGIPILLPAEKECACLGAAIVGAVTLGLFGSYEQAAKAVVKMEHCFEPTASLLYEHKHRQYIMLYDCMLAAQRVL